MYSGTYDASKNDKLGNTVKGHYTSWGGAGESDLNHICFNLLQQLEISLSYCRKT